MAQKSVRQNMLSHGQPTSGCKLHDRSIVPRTPTFRVLGLRHDQQTSFAAAERIIAVLHVINRYMTKHDTTPQSNMPSCKPTFPESLRQKLLDKLDELDDGWSKRDIQTYVTTPPTCRSGSTRPASRSTSGWPTTKGTSSCSRRSSHPFHKRPATSSWLT